MYLPAVTDAHAVIHGILRQNNAMPSSRSSSSEGDPRPSVAPPGGLPPEQSELQRILDRKD